MVLADELRLSSSEPDEVVEARRWDRAFLIPFMMCDEDVCVCVCVCVVQWNLLVGMMKEKQFVETMWNLVS